MLRKVALALTALAVLAACGARRDPPLAVAPPPPAARPTTTLDDDWWVEDTVESTTEVTVEEERPTPTTAPPTTTVPPTTVPATTTSTTSTTTPVPAAWAAFDAALSASLIGRGDFAAAVAVAVDGRIVHTGAYGYRVPPPLPPPAPSFDPASTAPATTTAPVATDPPEGIEPADRFRIASISKVITATVVLQLVEGGQIGLDEAVGARLAALVGATPADPAVGSITVRQLLSHTAGFPSYQGTFFGGSVDSCPTVANLGLSRALASAPGTVYTYSNLNYCLLGLLIEDVAGRPYEAVAQDRLLAPLGISGMRLAGTYDADPSEVVHPSAAGRNYMEVLGAAGSWVATPADIVTILDSLDTTKPGWHPLSSTMVELMLQPAPPPVAYRRPERWYGLGLFVYADGAWGHTGTVENTHSMVLRRPDGVTWSVLVSGEAPWESEDLRRIFDEAIATAGVTFA